MRSQIIDRRYATVPLTFDRKSIILLGLSKRFCPAKWIPYRGVAQLVARLLWEQDAGCSNHLTPTKSKDRLYGRSFAV